VFWQKTVREEVPHQEYTPKNEFASHSPVTDGTHVWASFGSRGVHCYDMAGGHKWSVDLGKMNVEEGEGSSPTLAGDALIIVMDHLGDSFIVALNKYTGEILWRRERDESTAWATPLVVFFDDKLQVITNATNRVRSYDVKTGDLIWECAGQTMNTVPSPVYGFGMVFCTSGFQGYNLQAIKLGYSGNLTGSEAIRWTLNKYTPYIPSPLLYGDKIYICDKNRAAISCYQAATGKMIFQRKKLKDLGEMYASPVGVANRIYFIDRKGTAAVIKHAEQFEILAINSLNDRFSASPAIVGNELYLKGETYFYCISEQ
jgi:outer membrane protein assembly factor BamB